MRPMSETLSNSNVTGMPAPAEVERAIRLTYTQAMLGAVFGASTGGMFLIGFALALGANNVILGLLSTIPQLFVVAQFISALLVERGISRKKLTIVFSMLQPLCWLLIAAIPLLQSHLDMRMRFTILIGVLSLAMVAAQCAGNARGSWVGELIPAERRGRFFGRCAMFAGIVGAVFAVIEGRFLDIVKHHGLLMFASLFLFGSLFGLATASLHVPQPDCKLPGDSTKPDFIGLIRESFQNKPFMQLMMTHACLALGGIAGPFFVAYMLRDVGVSFFAFGLLNTISTIAALASSSFWGKCVDRFGCRPILLLSLLIMGPLSLIWLGIPPGGVKKAYMLLPWTNALAGFSSSALNVAINTLIYKTSKPQGRSVQFALYGTLVTLIGAPMPLIGGWLVSELSKTMFMPDLRLTFYISALCIFAAAWVARKRREPKSLPLPHCVDQLSGAFPGPFRSLAALLFKPIEFL